MIKTLQKTLKRGQSKTTAKLVLFLAPTFIFSQAPNLGVTEDFVLFSSNGAVTNSGISHLTGNVGTNNGSSTGFGNVNGVMHDGDITSAQAAVDLLAAYADLNSRIPAFFPAPVLGNGQNLTAGVYQVSGASSLNLELILNGQNNPNAVFIFQLQGPLSTNANSKVTLINGAKACNVFWKVEGLVDMATGTTMRGTVIANNAGINMNTGDTLEGRAFSTTGAITLDGVLAYTPTCGGVLLTGPAAPDLGVAYCYGMFSSDGPVHNSGVTTITGDVGANVGLTTGYDPLLVTGNIHPIPDASTASCAADLLVAYNYLNGLPHDIELLYPAQFGANLVLTPHTYLLSGATTFTDTLYLDGRGNSAAVFVMKLNGALSTSTYSKVILINGTQDKNVYWMVNGAVDISDNSVFKGTIISQGAVNIYSGVTIFGRILSGVGAIETLAMEGSANIVAANCQTLVGLPTLTEENNSVSIFPNPFSDLITLSIADFNKADRYEIKIFSALGVQLVQQTLKEESTSLNTSNLSEGIYLYEVRANGNLISSGRVVSQK